MFGWLNYFGGGVCCGGGVRDNDRGEELGLGLRMVTEVKKCLTTVRHTPAQFYCLHMGDLHHLSFPSLSH